MSEDILDSIEIEQSDEEVREILNNVVLKIIKLDKGKETDLMRGLEEEYCVSHRLDSAVKTAEEADHHCITASLRALSAHPKALHTHCQRSH